MFKFDHFFIDLVQVLGCEARRLAVGTAHTAMIDITDVCNLRCPHCYYFHKLRDLAQEPAAEVWEERFRGLYRDGVRIVLLLGGEPALRQDVLWRADKVFPFVDVCTNGTVKIPTWFRHRIFLSLDGGPEMHDALRGKGVFSRVMDNYRGDPRVLIHMMLGKANYKDLETLVRTARENGLRGLCCSLYSPVQGEEDPLMLSPDQRRAVLDEIRRVRSLFPGVVRMSDRVLAWYVAEHDIRSCYWGRSVLHSDVSWRKRLCAGQANCAQCGCLSGAIGSPIQKLFHPREALQALQNLGMTQLNNGPEKGVQSLSANI